MIPYSKTSKILGGIIAAGMTVPLLTGCGSAGGGADENTLTVSYSQVIPDQLPLWIAEEAGYFQEQGLNVTLTNLTGTDGFPALVSGQVQLASIGGSEMIAAAGAGADIKYLATLTPVFPYDLYAKVDDPAQLRGKRIGVTSSSGSVYVATLHALEKIGLSPDDVTLDALGSVSNVNNALIAGTIDAAVSHPPASTAIEDAGFHSVLDLAQQNIPSANVGIAATAEYVANNEDTIRRFSAALLKAIDREKNDKNYSIQILQQKLNLNDPRALDETYEYYAHKVLPAVPTPAADQLQTSIDTLTDIPGVSGLDPSDIVVDEFFPSTGQ